MPDPTMVALELTAYEFYLLRTSLLATVIPTLSAKCDAATEPDERDFFAQKLKDVNDLVAQLDVVYDTLNAVDADDEISSDVGVSIDETQEDETPDPSEAEEEHDD